MILSDLLLYGLDEGGETAFTERLGDADRARLQSIARARLDRFAQVEVWDGPMCVLRLKRDPVLQT
jgi:hypothetical protein